MATASLDGPFRRLAITEAAGALTRIEWTGGEVAGDETPLLTEAAAPLRACFEGRSRVFDLPLRVAARHLAAWSSSPGSMPGRLRWRPALV